MQLAFLFQSGQHLGLLGGHQKRYGRGKLFFILNSLAGVGVVTGGSGDGDDLYILQLRRDHGFAHTLVVGHKDGDDAISAARPGARRENLENYIKRLEKLEEITSSYPGVEKSYAIQAGREVRVMVKPEQVSEDQMVILARELAHRIENELEYPGQIKVHVLRETKAVEYAK